jgi:hypothetical protein
MSHDWRQQVTTCDDVYIYQADLICNDCADDLMEELSMEAAAKNGGEVPDDWPPEDSDEYPQGPHGDGGGESDSPGHCGSGPACNNALTPPGGVAIGCPFGNPLTEEGARYTMRAIADDILDAHAHARAVGRLWLHLYGSFLKPEHLIRLQHNKISTELRTTLDPLKREHVQPINELYTDLDCVYGGATPLAGSSDPGKIVLWRLNLTPTGDFGKLDIVLLPEIEGEAHTFEDMIEEAVSDSAWD